MTDIELAKANLPGHSVCLCKNGVFFTDDRRGISPVMKFIAQNRDLSGYSAADLIVGKAAAMLFVKVGISEVYAQTLSKAGAEYLKAHGIPFTYKTLTDKIINREGTDICPMEKAVIGIDDAEEGYAALKARTAELKAAKI